MQLPVISARGIIKRYGHDEVLRGVDYDIHQGQVKAIIGPSGSGKSTLLRLLALLEHADGGSIHLDGDLVGARAHQNGSSRPAPERILSRQRRPVGMVFQKFNLFPHLTALENVMLAQVVVTKRHKKEAEERAMETLARVGLQNHGSHYPSELSGGQQQRVAIARAVVQQPRALLFDEPTSALDPELVSEVLRVMESLAAEGMTMVIVTHEIAFARKVADEIAFFDAGLILEQSAPLSLFENPQHERTRQFLTHVS
ncbi:polar amino acid transport system ATP-binding protein [Arthrobacter sp. cf158]|nr:polar amino acid transport system ATP-binding protein [Arthrobacter sp. cf158]